MRANRLLLVSLAAAALVACGDARTVEGEERQAGAECTTCHGYPPPPGAFGGLAAGHPVSPRCWDCHSQTVGEGNVLLPGGRHLDRVVNVGGRGPGCAACHGFPPATGDHPTHPTGACAKCHLGYTEDTTDSELHGNGRGDAIVQPLTGGTLRIEGWDCATCHQALGNQ